MYILYYNVLLAHMHTIHNANGRFVIKKDYRENRKINVIKNVPLYL